MNKLRAILVVLATASLGACGGSQLTCDDPQRYQESKLGNRIVAPDDLDNLQEGRDMRIPEPSSNEPRPAGSRCLELPPGYVSQDPE